MKQINIGLAGFGTIGTGVFKNIDQNYSLLSERLGVQLVVKKIAEKDWEAPHKQVVPEELRTTRWQDLVEDPSIRVIVELIGGTGLALELILAALKNGKAVVTANKALLSKHGKQIFETAEKYKTPVFFEAAVAGGIPIIKTISEAFVANHILSMYGIVNGTCNYILTRMSDLGQSFEDALKEAQTAGYAESDPTLDINGGDSAHKAAILASLAYGFWVPEDKIFVEGIQEITAEDILFAKQLGYRIKLLAIIKAERAGEIEVRVHPTLIPQGHVLASVGGVFNAVAVNGDVVGETLFYGRGAGQDATSSAVISDIAEAAHSFDSPRRGFGFTSHGIYGTCKPIDRIVSQYYLRVPVVDEPGVLGQVAGILGEEAIGISSVIQPESQVGGGVPLVLMLHDATNAQVDQAIARISKLSCVKNPPRLIRVETFA